MRASTRVRRATFARPAVSWLAGTILLKHNAMPTPGLLERIKV
jgi:hypothetical protein